MDLYLPLTVTDKWIMVHLVFSITIVLVFNVTVVLFLGV